MENLIFLHQAEIWSLMLYVWLIPGGTYTGKYEKSLFIHHKKNWYAISNWPTSKTNFHILRDNIKHASRCMPHQVFYPIQISLNVMYINQIWVYRFITKTYVCNSGYVYKTNLKSYNTFVIITYKRKHIISKIISQC